MRNNFFRLITFESRPLLVFVIITALIIGCKREFSLPEGAVSTDELKDVIDRFNDNEVTWEDFEKIISDSVNYSVVLNYASEHVKENDKSAQFLLGRCYDKGEGVSKNGIKAAEYYTKAAEQGYSPAQNNLGVCY